MNSHSSFIRAAWMTVLCLLPLLLLMLVLSSGVSPSPWLFLLFLLLCFFGMYPLMGDHTAPEAPPEAQPSAWSLLRALWLMRAFLRGSHT